MPRKMASRCSADEPGQERRSRLRPVGPAAEPSCRVGSHTPAGMRPMPTVAGFMPTKHIKHTKISFLPSCVEPVSQATRKRSWKAGSTSIRKTLRVPPRGGTATQGCSAQHFSWSSGGKPEPQAEPRSRSRNTVIPLFSRRLRDFRGAPGGGAPRARQRFPSLRPWGTADSRKTPERESANAWCEQICSGASGESATGPSPARGNR